MEKNNEITEVTFRTDTTKEFKGEVYALFPYEVEMNYNVLSYQHIGQHSTANYQHCINASRPSTEAEYENLKKELEIIGYNLKVIKKQNYNKFLIAYKNFIKRFNP